MKLKDAYSLVLRIVLGLSKVPLPQLLALCLKIYASETLKPPVSSCSPPHLMSTPLLRQDLLQVLLHSVLLSPYLRHISGCTPPGSLAGSPWFCLVRVPDHLSLQAPRGTPMTRACALCPPSSEKEALSNRAIAQREAGSSELAYRSAALSQEAENSFLLVTATPVTSAHPVIPEHTQALADCDRNGCTNRHFCKEDIQRAKGT